MWTQSQERPGVKKGLRALLLFSGLLHASILAQTCTPASAPAQNGLSMASSADGTKLAAVGCYGWLYLSTNSGATWTPAATVTNGPEPSRPWTSVACSADGMKFFAVANSNPVFTSTNSGLTWSSHGPALSWNAVASSSDGAKLVAADYNMGRLYSSADS